MSEDPDLVVTSVDPSLREISKPELRRKLISFLAVCLPPIPLSYDTYEAHVKAQFQTYYDTVLREVFDSLLIGCTRRRLDNINGVTSSNDLITISSSDESESEEPEAEEHSRTPGPKTEANSVESFEPAPLATPASASKSDVSATPRSNGCEEKRPRALSDEELLAFKAEKCTKKYTKYLQETYNLIKNIETTSSCSICCKLKRRIQKFVSSVGQESAIIQQKVAKELRAHRIDADLTSDALEKMRMSILIDRLIEISMPDILKRVEMMNSNANGSCKETEQMEEFGRKKKKKRDKRKGEESAPTELDEEEGKVKKKKKDKNKNDDSKKKNSKFTTINQSHYSPGKPKAKKISLKIKESDHPNLQ